MKIVFLVLFLLSQSLGQPQVKKPHNYPHFYAHQLINPQLSSRKIHVFHWSDFNNRRTVYMDDKGWTRNYVVHFLEKKEWIWEQDSSLDRVRCSYCDTKAPPDNSTDKGFVYSGIQFEDYTGKYCDFFRKFNSSGSVYEEWFQDPKTGYPVRSDFGLGVYNAVFVDFTDQITPPAQMFEPPVNFKQMCSCIGNCSNTNC